MALVGVLAAAAAIVSMATSVYSILSQPEQEKQQRLADPLYQPTQIPQVPPFQPMGLPQQPQYQTPPAITQFPLFQSLFGQRRMGE